MPGNTRGARLLAQWPGSSRDTNQTRLQSVLPLVGDLGILRQLRLSGVGSPKRFKDVKLHEIHQPIEPIPRQGPLKMSAERGKACRVHRHAICQRRSREELLRNR